MLPDAAKIPFLIDVAKTLRGSSKRRFMARAVKSFGRGGQRWAEENLGWCRDTIRRGLSELEARPSGPSFSDLTRCRAAEKTLPRLLEDIRSVVERYPLDKDGSLPDQGRARPSAAEVRRRLIAEKGYGDFELPTRQTLNKKMNMLGYAAGEKLFPSGITIGK